MLDIYLNDHLAIETAAIEAVRRARGENEGTELGDYLAELATELEQDRTTLRETMASVGVGPDRLKQAAAWAGEKAGRLKLNGSVFSYSPLIRIVELEGLSLAVAAKAGMWRMLRELSDPRLEGADFDGLLARADRQADELERRRIDAGLVALEPG